MKDLKLISGNPATKHRTWDERWKIVTDYFKNTTEQRKNMSNHDKRKWMNWLKSECRKSLDKGKTKHYRSKKALRQRIKAKWWSINHRYADDKNKKRTTVKNFITKQASYQDIWKIRNWAKQRMETLNRKSRLTRKKHQKINGKARATAKKRTSHHQTEINHKNKPKLNEHGNQRLNISNYLNKNKK